MKVARIGTVAILLGFVTAARAEEPRPTSTVRVNVGMFRNRSGALGCRLYSAPAGFPDGSAGAIEKRVVITGDSVRSDFENVPSGTYAIACMHDENANGRLDKSFLGFPSEGYGVSNNHTHAMSAPTWDESKFVVERGKDAALAIALRYYSGVVKSSSER